MEDFIYEPAYVRQDVKPSAPRLLVFENEGRGVNKREFVRYGLKVVSAWTDDPVGRAESKKGDLEFSVRPGYRVFAEIRSA